MAIKLSIARLVDMKEAAQEAYLYLHGHGPKDQSAQGMQDWRDAVEAAHQVERFLAGFMGAELTIKG